MVTNFVIGYAYGVELNLPASINAGGFYAFSNQNLFDQSNMFIVGLEAYSAAQIATAPSGAAVVPAAGVLNATLTLSDGALEIVDALPVNEFVPVVNNGFIKSFKPFKCKWTSSGVTLNSTSGLAASQSFYFTFFADIIKQ
jgi:hypothetical protein